MAAPDHGQRTVRQWSDLRRRLRGGRHLGVVKHRALMSLLYKAEVVPYSKPDRAGREGVIISPTVRCDELVGAGFIPASSNTDYRQFLSQLDPQRSWTSCRRDGIPHFPAMSELHALRLVVLLRVLAAGALSGGLGAFVDVTTDCTLPADGLVAFEDGAV